MKESARVVIIGGGIFGTSVAYHLALAGCTDVVLLDKGELTSGTTFHSVGLVSQFRTSPSLMQVMNYTIRLFNSFKKETGDALGWHTVGSLRLASSPQRLKGLMREVSRARAIGIEAEIIGPSEVLKKAPFLSDKDLYGAVWVPDDGHIDPSSITYEFARRARRMGVEIMTNTRVTGLGVSKENSVSFVDTTRGRIRTGCVVNAAGEWAPRVSGMVGAKLPMVPLMHQYLTTKPIPGFELKKDTPVVRDPDRLFYCREDAGAFLIGAFELNPKVWSPEGVAWEFNQELLPAEWDLFEPVLEMAIERIPLLAQAEAVELVNGPDAFTPDGHYALGPVPEIKGFYVAAGGSINGIAGAGGVGRLLAEWILKKPLFTETHEMNVRRFGNHLCRQPWLNEHCREVYRYYYGMRFPGDENEWGRPGMKSPLYERLMELGAVFGEKNGRERVNYFDEPGHGRAAGADQGKGWQWGRPDWFDRVAEEVRTARTRVAVLDMTSFGKIRVEGPGALSFLQGMTANNLNRPEGSVTYTQMLNSLGGIEADVTVARIKEQMFMIVSGTSCAASDLGWLRLHLPDDGSVTMEDISEDYACLAVFGPFSGHLLAGMSEEFDKDSFSFMTGRFVTMAGTRLWAQRVSYSGEPGWELFVENQAAEELLDLMLEKGKPFGLAPVGYKALDSLRMEKGYLMFGSDITPGDDPFSAGLGRFVDLDKEDFTGKESLLKILEKGIEKRLAALTLDAGFGLFGGESVFCRGEVIGRIRSTAYGHTMGRDIAFVYLPKSLAEPGTEVEVELMGKMTPAVVSALPLV